MLPDLVTAVGSLGQTPAQTVSYELQKLREEGELFFSSRGRYVLRDVAVNPVVEDLPDDVIQHGLEHNRLQLSSDVQVSEVERLAGMRRGQEALRQATLDNYGRTCALCDVREEPLLVASHIARWADNPQARGSLTNTISFCALHDRLFELGYFALNDDLHLIIRAQIGSDSIRTWLHSCTGEFRGPARFHPSPEYLREHRKRVHLDAG